MTLELPDNPARLARDLDGFAMLMDEAAQVLSAAPTAVFKVLAARHALCDELDGSAIMARAAAAGLATPWQPIATVPKDGTPVLVYLEAPLQKSRVHAARFSEKGISVIATLFSFDAPKPTHWRLMLDGPTPPAAVDLAPRS